MRKSEHQTQQRLLENQFERFVLGEKNIIVKTYDNARAATASGARLKKTHSWKDSLTALYRLKTEQYGPAFRTEIIPPEGANKAFTVFDERIEKEAEKGKKKEIGKLTRKNSQPGSVRNSSNNSRIGSGGKRPTLFGAAKKLAKLSTFMK